MPFFQKIKKFFRALYTNLVTADDSPHRVAAGFGLGVFLGIFPGVGPIASLVVAEIIKVNRAAALAGCLLTNTWISVVTFVLSAQVGAIMTGESWRKIYEQCELLFKHFHWKDLWNVSFLKIVFPLILGYFLVGLSFGLLAYGVVFLLLSQKRVWDKRKR